MKSLRCSVSPRLAHSLAPRHPGLPLSRAHDGRAEGRERVPVTATDPSGSSAPIARVTTFADRRRITRRV